MNKLMTVTFLFLGAMVLTTNSWAGQPLPMMQLAEANPCSMKQMNPCDMKHKNPCDMKMHNPCDMKHKNPCDMKMHNPCGMKHKNPCGGMAADHVDAKLIMRPAGVALFAGASRAQLVKDGERLFRDSSLSPNKTTCNDCHATNDLFKAGFAKPYPHKVGMAKERAGVTGSLQADEFVQFCMLAPMASKPLAWDSRELAALAAYVTDVKQKDFRAAMKMNPCAMKGGAKMHNPCSMKHQNPCDIKMHNPCSMQHKNPCSM